MRYKKILLISPRFHRGKFRLSGHPLAGLGYVAESLSQNGIEVRTIDMNLQHSYETLIQTISAFKPDLIGFTVLTFGHRDLYNLIAKIKRSYPDTTIVVGGPHVSTMRTKVLQDCREIDYGIVLEGDHNLVQLCKGEDISGIGGLIYRRDNAVVMNNPDKFILDLDSLAFPKYCSFELNEYPLRQIGIVTSRGCPYDCIYCPVVLAIGKQFRQRSAQNVADEIIYWYKKGYREILILDDNFTLNRKRVEDICNLLEKANLKNISLKCPNGIRADRVDYELLKMMRNVGFDMISFGVEAADNNVLANIKKGENIEIVERSIRDACRLGFDVDLFFLLGSPGETLENIRSSFALALRYPIRSAKFYNIVPFPGTELFEWIARHGYFTHSMTHILNNASHFINEPCFFTPEMSIKDRKKAFRMGRSISRRIRRNFIERRINSPFKKIISFLYSSTVFEDMINNNNLLVRMKEKMKNLYIQR